MEWIALGARVLLALVFVTAAVGKFVDRAGARRALAGFGVPSGWTARIAVALPIVELGTGVALMVPQSARWGASAALALLTVFVAGIAAAMSRGEAPDCHCFGQLSSAPAGWQTLIRNAALALPAVLVVVNGPGIRIESSGASGSSLELVAAGTGVVIIALAALVAHLWIANGALRRERAR
jgi:uncharacterized membrane protein YphA (DoxX/SURF4 family)